MLLGIASNPYRSRAEGIRVPHGTLGNSTRELVQGLHMPHPSPTWLELVESALEAGVVLTAGVPKAKACGWSL